MAGRKFGGVHIPMEMVVPFCYKQRGVKTLVYLDLTIKTVAEQKLEAFGAVENAFLWEAERLFNNIRMQVEEINEGELDLHEKDQELVKELLLYAHFESKPSQEEQAVAKPVTIERTGVAHLRTRSRSVFLDDYCLKILVNRSGTGFVLPFRCVYSVEIQGAEKPAQILPVSPKCAILLLNIRDEDVFGKQLVGYVRKQKTAWRFNERAFYAEKTSHKKLLIGSQKELHRLKEKFYPPKEMEASPIEIV